MPISGQYVRRSDQQQVYLVPEAITVVTTLAYWLDSSLTNVMTAKIESVEQYAGAQAAAPEFTLVKDSKLGEAGRAQFSLKEGVEGDKKLKDVATTQIPSGLENLAIQDVAKAGEDSVKDLSFDKKTVYSLSNGLRYTVLSAEKGEKSFISLAVDFDSKLAAELKARADSAASAAAAVSSVASSSGAETSGPAASAAGNPAATGIASSAAVDPISNVEEAAKLNDQYKNWVYEVRKFQVQKFRYSKDQLFEAPLPASSAATSSIAPAASPAVKKK